MAPRSALSVEVVSNGDLVRFVKSPNRLEDFVAPAVNGLGSLVNRPLLTPTSIGGVSFTWEDSVLRDRKGPVCPGFGDGSLEGFTLTDEALDEERPRVGRLSGSGSPPASSWKDLSIESLRLWPLVIRRLRLLWMT